MSENTVLGHYNPNKKLVLVTDASQEGLSAILYHRETDGEQRPIRELAQFKRKRKT